MAIKVSNTTVIDDSRNIGNIGIATFSSLKTIGTFRDSTDSPGTSGQVLQSTVTGTLWATASAAAAGGSGKFDTTIDNVIYVQPTGTLDIVGVGTTVTQITTFPAGNDVIVAAAATVPVPF